MNQITYGVILFVLVIAILLALNLTRQKVLAKLKNILFVENNPALYFQALQSSRLPLLLRRNSILLLKLDGLMYKGANAEIESTIDELDSIRLKPAEKLEFLQKKLSYYVGTQNRERATAAFESLDRFIGKADVEKYQKIMEEARLLIQIYIEKDTHLIGRLIADSEQQADPYSKGITQYRIAKLAYYKDDSKLMNQFLACAKQNLQGTPWQTIIEQAMKDSHILEVK